MSKLMAMGGQRLGRLRWLCRRGMKELDVLLERFLADEAACLEAGAWPDLEALLQTEDDRLWDWLQHAGRADAARYHPLLERIRHGAESLH